MKKRFGSLCKALGIAALVYFVGSAYLSRHMQGFVHISYLEAMQEELNALTESLAQEPQVLEVLASNTNLSSGIYSAADMFRAIDNSVVSINVTTPHVGFGLPMPNQSAGSGIIFHQDNENVYIVTNYHVVSGAQAVTVSLDDINEAPAHFVGAEEASDIAIIFVQREALRQAGITNYEVATFGDSDLMEIGNFVLAVGNAYGDGKSATLGIVSAMDKTITVSGGITLNVLQTDAAINPGNSGGPLVNTNGEVIGINTARLMTARSEGMGYAIPSNEFVPLLERIMEQGDVQTPLLGVTTFTITEYMMEEHNLPNVGVFVNSVGQGHAAYDMGLMPGDIITHYNGHRVYTSEELGRLILLTDIGAPVNIQALRGGRVLSFTGNMTAFRGQGQTNF